jgi:hypothetical protein
MNLISSRHCIHSFPRKWLQHLVSRAARPSQNQVYVLQPTGNIPPSDPGTVIIYAWGDGQPKHIIKYADGYRALCPHSQIIIVLCTLLESIFQTVFKRTQAMLPVIHAAGILPKSPDLHRDNRTLVQAMSNSGTVSFIATLLAYRMVCRDRSEEEEPFPCKLSVFDSAPGGTSLVRNLGRWSLALAVATSAVIPLPILLMRVVWAGVFLLGEGIQRITRWPAVGRDFPGPIQDPRLVSTGAHRLFLYSTTEGDGRMARCRGFGCPMAVGWLLLHYGDVREITPCRAHEDGSGEILERDWQGMGG